jgi:hypothetical protein
MSDNSMRTLAASIIAAVLVANHAGRGFSQEENDLEQTTRRAISGQQYELRYKMRPGEVLRWKVEQMASTETRVAGHEEKSSLRSRSGYIWTVQDVDSLGNMTFENKLDSASEWQKIGDEDPVSWDSAEQGEVPDLFLATAEKIGKPIATITLNPRGEIVNRVDLIKSVEIGVGPIAIPLPERKVAIDAQWEIAEDLQARRKDTSIKTLKTRVLYTLRDVDNGIATISFRREILTPVDDAWIQMQLQQKMNQGSIEFDIPNGRIVRRIVQWDEQVQGFEGDDSFLRYLGSYSLELDSAGPASSNAASPLKPAAIAPGNRSSTNIKPTDGKPIIRK